MQAQPLQPAASLDPNGVAGPERAYCDLIMKGGITSGVVYPKLISGLAAKYRFKSVGGTSAGAIAAAGCAAAEFRRWTGGGDAGFRQLAALPETLGKSARGSKGSILRNLFQPSEALSRHFDVLLASLNRPSKVAIVVNALGTLLLRYWAIVALVAVVMLAVVVALIRSTGPFAWGGAWRIATIGSAAWLFGGWWLVWRYARRAADPSLLPRFLLWWIGGIAAVFWLLREVGGAQDGWLSAALASFSWGVVLVLTLGLAFVVCGWKFVTSLLAGLHANFWGICSGLSTQANPPIAGLTVWLTGYFNEVAGLGPDERPLTLGDLWDGKRATGGDLALSADTETPDRTINLEVMTTAVSRQMPYAIPFRAGSGAYFFDPEEWKRLFPTTVMNWILEASPPNPPEGGMQTEDGRVLRRLPANRHLPVVLLVRMSLSFPVLLSAVPLYAVDFSGETTKKFAKKVWFSDGGIASNMPLHFFDAPLPGRPTFAVNLKDEHPDHPIRTDLPACAKENGRVYLPDNNSSGLQRFWKAPEDDSPLGLFKLLWGMVETMHSWHDDIQLPMPGYRDRVVQIAQKPDEGGLNLDMPADSIKALSEAGLCAAERLIERFAPTPEVPMAAGWQNHREIRFRTFIALAEGVGRHRAIHNPSWDDLLAGDLGYTAEEHAMAVRTLGRLRDIGPPVQRESELLLLRGAPKPRPIWRIFPRI